MTDNSFDEIEEYPKMKQGEFFICLIFILLNKWSVFCSFEINQNHHE